MQPLASLRGVTYSYPGTAQPALRDLDLDVVEGELLLVIGPSGSGKSTFLRLLNGLVPHFHGGTVTGSVRVAGLDPIEVGPGEMSGVVGLVFQDPEAQIVTEVVDDEIAFGMENLGWSRERMRRQIEEVCDALGISHLRGRRLSTLSGGERQRVAIAAVLALQPQLLVLDEPTSQLDPQSAEEVIDAVVKLNKDFGLTAVMSEHRLERVAQHADRILQLDANGVYQIGLPREILATSPVAPPLVEVARHMGWSPVPLSVKEARRFLQPTGSRSHEVDIITEGAALSSGEGIELRDVTFAYSSREVLHKLNLEIGAGETVALLGRNGTGKTTLLKLALGLLKPHSGTVTVMGLDTRRVGLAEVGKRVGYVPQQPDSILFAETVEGEVEFTRRAHGLPPNGVTLLEDLGLSRYLLSDPRDLSVGERQRVALAAALAGEPGALVLDEPTRGLDYGQKENLVAILRAFRARGGLVLLATHDVELSAQVAGRVVILGEGGIVADGPAREVFADSVTFATQVGRLFRDPDLLTVDDVRRWVAPIGR
jgi:energy-coupling factor transport system ATP-binding protein